jgi:hypothetical protein
VVSWVRRAQHTPGQTEISIAHDNVEMTSLGGLHGHRVDALSFEHARGVMRAVGKVSQMSTAEHYWTVTGDERTSVQFENATLQVDKATLPQCAQDVLDGRGASGEYWAWLIVQWFTAAVSDALAADAARAGECSGANPYEVAR